ncbi:peptide/nickel transport system permease protein [Flavobacterium sp. 7E]|uniref:ABC transporter permease n=1 Tax=unclassified Flavobacterium TaxID=196869 RepID=UPI001570614E|nr:MULTISPECIES: ABC transporter permease [unclassified Flavobacterium]MBE0392591.1 Oligopeptide transport system permease protein OppC [Flavobacterium sp. PL002]NRS88997.1 peptide/nickel transport system permease protein [Flavobacterium sp. 7E]
MNNNTQSLTAIALQKFKKNFWGVFSFAFILVLVFVSVFAYVLAPDKSANANQMHLSIHSKPPGFNVKIMAIPLGDKIESSFSDYFFGGANSLTEIPISSYKIKNNVIEYVAYSDEPSLQMVKEVSLKSFVGETSIEAAAGKFISSRTFYLGTDKYGRDLLSRMLIGSRVSISIGVVAVVISLVVGIFFGAIGGYFGGKTDALIMWVVNIIWSIPTLLLVIAITLALGKGFWQVFVAVGLTMWVEVARVVRGQVISVKEMQYVTAAKALGFGNFRIIFNHILPNIMAPVIVISAANFASAILVESGLSFLGLGAQPPIPSWGSIIKDHYSYIILGKPYLAMVPGLAIMSLTLAFMMMGNALRDALDVKQ